MKHTTIALPLIALICFSMHGNTIAAPQQTGVSDSPEAATDHSHRAARQADPPRSGWSTDGAKIRSLRARFVDAAKKRAEQMTAQELESALNEMSRDIRELEAAKKYNALLAELWALADEYADTRAGQLAVKLKMLAKQVRRAEVKKRWSDEPPLK